MIRRARSLAIAGAIALAPLSAVAQTTTEDVPRYGYGPMMWGGWGWGFPGMVIGPLMMLIVIGGTIALTVWLLRGVIHIEHHDHHSRAALDILEQRFARGEIDKAEFEDKRKILRS